MMIYQLGKDWEELDILPTAPGRLTAACLDVSEIERLAPTLGLSAAALAQCRNELRYFRSDMEVYDTYSFGALKRTGQAPGGEDFVAFFIMKDLFLVVDVRDADGSTRRHFLSALRRFPPAAVTAEKLVFAFLYAMTEGDGRRLEDLEYDFSRLEEKILGNEAGEDFAQILLRHKRQLLLLHNFYEQMVEVGEALGEDENDLFPPGDLRYFKIFTDRAERLGRNVADLREQLSQLRDAYQSMLDLRLNHTMKTFTVISAIFLPLTLITGWYGMNFRFMPELDWKYGYLFVAGLMVFVALFCIAIFHRRNWM